MVNIIIHELLHSWTGNLVTHRNFEHFWLNEGLTVFLERKIIGHLISQQEQDFQAYQGTTDLKFTVSIKNPYKPIDFYKTQKPFNFLFPFRRRMSQSLKIFIAFILFFNNLISYDFKSSLKSSY